MENGEQSRRHGWPVVRAKLPHPTLGVLSEEHVNEARRRMWEEKSTPKRVDRPPVSGKALAAADPSLAEFVELEARIEAADRRTAEARLEIGFAILRDRAAHGGRLPPGWMKELAEELGRTEKELLRWARLAKQLGGPDGS